MSGLNGLAKMKELMLKLRATAVTEIGGVKISADYTTNADDVAASTSAVQAAYNALKAYIDEQIAALSGEATT